MGVVLGALDADRVLAPSDRHAEGLLDGAQVLLDRAGQVGEARVVGGSEGVAEDHGAFRLSSPTGQVRFLLRSSRPMLGRLVGTLVEKSPPQVLVDVGGVGYEVDVPMSTFYELPALGQPVTLLTHLVVREDQHQLFGFRTAGERATFRLLVKISGIGPRTALALLSGLSVDDLAQAVATQETGRLVKVPGIGKKTAERLLLELKGKLAEVVVQPASAASGGASGDIVQALISLGYNDRDALAAAKALPPDVEVADGIRLALKALAR
jgi:Holliday junction DNA helicase RuvA